MEKQIKISIECGLEINRALAAGNTDELFKQLANYLANNNLKMTTKQHQNFLKRDLYEHSDAQVPLAGDVLSKMEPATSLPNWQNGSTTTAWIMFATLHIIRRHKAKSNVGTRP